MSQRLSLEKKGRGYSSWEGADAGGPFPGHDFRCTILLGKTSSAAGGGGSRFCHSPIRRRAAGLDGVLPTSPIFAQNHYPERTSFIPGLLERAQASGSDTAEDSRVGKKCVPKTEPLSVEMKCLCSQYAVRLGLGLHLELVPLAPPPPSRHRWCLVSCDPHLCCAHICSADTCLLFHLRPLVMSARLDG